ncbi:hypothetical protein NOF55_21215 [Rhizobiaceae bacterium BDR2-2]|uniref:Polymerase n=1 Tax=Ectorhizobium quercum TaxID=2965071 RepID=A0AAE3N5H6_9HYPH|nr:hypothetical protein [Ectorhizobium quercum]MCX8999630.1 hypothetical protein [Ectorhizobium quercum]
MTALARGDASKGRRSAAAVLRQSSAAAPSIEPPQGENPTSLLRLINRLLIVTAVIGGLTFNFLLCFVNTRITQTWESYVMLCELILIVCAFAAAFDRKAGIYLFLGIFVAYMVLLFTFRGETDAKAVRDIIVPVAFYFMGAKARNLPLADTLVAVSVAIVVAFGLFEYLAPELFLDYFNVLGYYLSRGSLNLHETFGNTRGFFISGLRPEPRTILPFLGQHRVASIFLEPVSTGNFGVIAYSWALFRTGMRLRIPVMVGALIVIALGDARFGLYTCALITALLPFLRFTPRLLWFVMPFMMLALVAAYGIATGTQGGDNSLGGRMAVTAHILTALSLDVVLGLETTDQFTADSGLAYTLTKFGIGGFIALWGALVFAPIRDPKAWTYLTMVLIYLLLLMLISNSFYSIKTGALLWFILGTATHVDLPDTRSKLMRFLLPDRIFAPRGGGVSAPATDRPEPSPTGLPTRA